jgi:hypothetical protein
MLFVCIFNGVDVINSTIVSLAQYTLAQILKLTSELIVTAKNIK